MVKSLLFTLNGAGVAVCLFSAFLLFMQNERIRSRYILSAILFSWGIFYISAHFVIGSFADTPFRGILHPFGLVSGAMGSAIMSFYIIEVIRSGWLNWLRVLAIMTPCILTTIFYFTVLFVRKEAIETLTDTTAFYASLTHFNVWFRLAFLLLAAIYLSTILWILVYYSPRYRKWTEDNYSSSEQMNISWLWIYLLGLLLMVIIFYYIMIDVSGIPLICHYILTIPYFSFIAYKGLFHRNPYPENYFQEKLLEEEVEATFIIEKEKETPAFIEKMEEYRLLFEAWMEKDKPYLKTDFKLSDVSERHPMNRTYLARFFNESYGYSFSHVVRRYRIEEAIRIIRQNPTLISKELYPLCGFASETVFHRTFVEVMGITPKQYRDTQKINFDL